MADEDLGKCPACGAGLITNRRDERAACHVSLPGKAPPPKAYYPDFYHDMEAVWCPSCGLAKSVAIRDIDLSWTTSEFRGWEDRRQRGS